VIGPVRRPLRVKLILPALTEATSPYWQPIKYSLFPPLGLATIAAYLDPEDEAELVDEHVMALDADARLGTDPGLYHQRASSAYRIADAYRAMGVFVALGGLHVTSLQQESRRARGYGLPRSGGAKLCPLPCRFSRRRAASALRLDRRADPGPRAAPCAAT
jgi:hypothetical protein